MTPQERIAAAQARREAQRAEEAAAHAEQQATDIEALADLEAEHGFDRVLSVTLSGWKPGAGAATLVVVRVPMKSEGIVKRYEAEITRPKPDIARALHTLAEACVVYPHRKDQKPLYDATLELAPAVLSKAGELIIKAVQGKADEEKKD